MAGTSHELGLLDILLDVTGGDRLFMSGYEVTVPATGDTAMQMQPCHFKLLSFFLSFFLSAFGVPKPRVGGGDARIASPCICESKLPHLQGSMLVQCWFKELAASCHAAEVRP